MTRTLVAYASKHGSTEEVAVFALGPLTLEVDQVAGSRKQLENALTHLGVYPQFVTVFGGVVDPEKLHFPFNRMPQVDARDSQEIRRWAGEVAVHFADHADPAPIAH